MRPVDVIPSKRYQHKTTGRTASIYGAHPASGAPGDQDTDWEIVTVGWTVRNDNGTTGIGRQPWATKEGAENYLAQHGARPVVEAYNAKNGTNLVPA